MANSGEYIKNLESALKDDNATEHTHRPALKAFIESLRRNVVATNEPRRIECGSPDFIVTLKGIPLGYVEAKDIGIDLHKAESSEQLRRYRSSLRNLVLTDYIDFRLYRNGELVREASLGTPNKNGSLRRTDEGEADVEGLLNSFLDADVPSISNPRELAERMARIARLLHDLIREAFVHEQVKGDLHSQYEAFRKVLISELTVDEFADMYAQTIAYGLFAARCNHEGSNFTRQDAGRALPKTNPFLRRLFNAIAGADLDDRISWAVDDLADLLARADIESILKDFGRATRREDPVVHFYETFLAAYDPKLREARGVYYTPEPVVDYIVRSVDIVLKRDFGLKDGLAHRGKVRWTVPTPHGKQKTKSFEAHRVQVLDPACGTGTFLHKVIAQIRETFKGSAGMWPAYVAEHLLPRIYGFELLMAPYAVAHMKLGLQLSDTGYDFATDERLRVFLTNSLEEAHEFAGLPLFAHWLADEAAAASEAKREAPIMVVLGNPPYSGHSSNKGAWIEGLMEEYKQSPELKKPAQAKWLSDDYVKFMRFSQWRIEQTGYGVLGFITNHSWLDNPTFVDMRASLMKTFDELYVFDLHGSTKKRESAPDGTRDENVFDIQQGVAISLFIKRGPEVSEKAVYHAELFGLRKEKYAWLEEHDISNTKWNTLKPRAPRRLFLPQDEDTLNEFQSAWSIVDVMNQSGAPVPGFATQHDDFAISFSPKESIEKVRSLLATSDEPEARRIFDLCAQKQWSYAKAKKELTIPEARNSLIEISYRPFDIRSTIYDSNVLTHRRERISRHLLKPNLALVVPKNAEAIGSEPSQFFFCVDKPTDLNFYRRGGAYLIPLWVYPEGDLLGETEKQFNFANEFLAALKDRLNGISLTPEDVFAYIYSILWSPSYHARYEVFLKRDFPRVPLTSDVQLFKKLVRAGTKLVDLHLMRTTGPRQPDFPVTGSNRVEEIRYEKHRVYINALQYFDAVSQAVWDCQIGGYPVAYKWLKDRKGRLLTYDDLQHYGGTIAALDETLRIQQHIDGLILKWPLE